MREERAREGGCECMCVREEEIRGEGGGGCECACVSERASKRETGG